MKEFRDMTTAQLIQAFIRLISAAAPIDLDKTFLPEQQPFYKCADEIERRLNQPDAERVAALERVWDAAQEVDHQPVCGGCQPYNAGLLHAKDCPRQKLRQSLFALADLEAHRGGE